jgi:hypothetical protein
VFYLIAGVVVAIVSTALNLLLTFGVIRRLRVHDTLLAEHGGHAGSEATVPVGSTVPALTATTVDGRAASSVHPDGTQLIGFFSPGCTACEERIPEFLRYHRRSGVAALAIIAGTAGSADHVARLSGHVDVVVEDTPGEFGTAFGVTSYPALCLVDPEGVLLAGGNTIQQLPEFIRG